MLTSRRKGKTIAIFEISDQLLCTRYSAHLVFTVAMMQNWLWRSRETAADVVQVSELFLVLRHAIDTHNSKGPSGEFGNSASH